MAQFPMKPNHVERAHYDKVCSQFEAKIALLERRLEETKSLALARGHEVIALRAVIKEARLHLTNSFGQMGNKADPEPISLKAVDHLLKRFHEVGLKVEVEPRDKETEDSSSGLGLGVNQADIDHADVESGELDDDGVIGGFAE